MFALHRVLVALVLVTTTIPADAADRVYGTVSPWGQLVDPDGDCSFSISHDSVTIGFSGAAHGLDAEHGRMNAPRVLRTMNGDFAVQVTVDGNLPLPNDDDATAYVSGGLVLLQDDRNYIRLERASFTRRGTVNHYANFEQRIDARRTRMGLFRDYPLASDQPAELRLEVRSGTVRALARIVGQPWHEMGTAEVDLEASFSVGISGVNTSQQPVRVTYRNIQHQTSFVAVEDESSSEIDLSSPPRVVAVTPSGGNALNKFVTAMMSIQRRSRDIDSMERIDRQSLVDDATKLLRESDIGVSVRMAPNFAAGLSRAFQTAGDREMALAVYGQFVEAMSEFDDEKSEQTVKYLISARDRLQFKLAMIGKPLELEGETLSGESFDWQSYRGKIVLVDFWASWCGPCRREIPNVLEQYRQYHDRGFDVVGVCLDSKRDTAMAYVREEDLPWDSLFVDGAGWKHPMAVKYKVSAIPTAILLDRDGQVVSISARGDELRDKLLELIGTPQVENDRTEESDESEIDRE